MRRPYGLRPRLLAALVLTAAVTLLAAALTLFGPLQERLREENADSLRASVIASREAITQQFRKRDFSEASSLARRESARVSLYTTAPTRPEPREPIFDTE